MESEHRETEFAHEPVMLAEVIEWLQPGRAGTFVDCTLGLGGHAEALLKASPDIKVIGIDRDLEALSRAQERLSKFGERFQGAHANFDTVAEVLSDMEVSEVQGVLADLGVSSLQLDKTERGFSFATDAPLDMRMDRTLETTAADLVDSLSEGELADVIFRYGEERGARKVARLIAKERQRQPVTTTRQLADLVVRALNIPGRWRIHPATRTFQALRIAVNQELDSVERFIPQAVSALARGGRLAVISFHSLEDRIVKRGFLLEQGRCTCQPEPKANRRGGWRGGRAADFQERPGEGGDARDETATCNRCGARRRVRILTRKPMRPGPEEVERNPRARSALLRVSERL
ncbi:MAG TPA: 16S rRNA (cytosine(1402)-N(4))-methyltransferase RsmH [Blastocatellia bacterium]|nr:16S rRNA (cytosine(1402)-N(4))-methyltransferase RsmH [Blastocatellia bacterium]